MKARYINDGTIPKRENQTHWAMPEYFGEIGEITEIDESKGLFEFKLPLIPPILCNREELEIYKEHWIQPL